MFLGQFSQRSRLATVALAGGLLAAGLTAGSVSAAPPLTADQCASQQGEVAVELVAIAQGRTLNLQATPPDGNYVGTSNIHVFCQDPTTLASRGDVAGAAVQITINPTQPGLTPGMFTITGTGVTTPGNPVTIGPFDGTASFTVVGASNLLPPGVAAEKVGVDIQVVTGAFSGSLLDPTTGTTLAPFTGGDVLAKTPELDSIALFATGALGLLSYVGLRRRARRSPKD